MFAAIYGVATVAVWFLLRRQGGEGRALTPLTVVIGLLALQGGIGGLQWARDALDRRRRRAPRAPQRGILRDRRRGGEARRCRRRVVLRVAPLLAFDRRSQPRSGRPGGRAAGSLLSPAPAP